MYFTLKSVASCIPSFLSLPKNRSPHFSVSYAAITLSLVYDCLPPPNLAEYPPIYCPTPLLFFDRRRPLLYRWHILPIPQSILIPGKSFPGCRKNFPSFNFKPPRPLIRLKPFTFEELGPINMLPILVFSRLVSGVKCTPRSFF